MFIFTVEIVSAKLVLIEILCAVEKGIESRRASVELWIGHSEEGLSSEDIVVGKVFSQ